MNELRLVLEWKDESIRCEDMEMPQLWRNSYQEKSFK